MTNNDEWWAVMRSRIAIATAVATSLTVLSFLAFGHSEAIDAPPAAALLTTLLWVAPLVGYLVVSSAMWRPFVGAAYLATTFLMLRTSYNSADPTEGMSLAFSILYLWVGTSLVAGLERMFRSAIGQLRSRQRGLPRQAD
ncbi:MAG: hypothetical protein H0W70_14475 [Actinobacteria bacterium]|nr:hypothetical protein [Actinomycetota bacterium]